MNVKIIVTVILASTFFSFQKPGNETLPQGWFKAGSKPAKYTMGTDNSTVKTGASSAFIESQKNKVNGFGTLMQSCSAQNYLGKKVKMSAYVKTENVEKWAGLWLRVDGTIKNKVLSFDNMQNRKIKGSTAWTKYEIILDVPKESITLNFGALLVGNGKIWFDEITFSEVNILEKSTGKTMLDKPTNTDFEEN